MGGKSVNIDSKFQLKKCAKRYHHAGNDWLSRLPDAILIGILSSLPLKEAARTSILSSRWENLWKHTLHLDFDAHSALCRITKHFYETEIRTVERRKYINWVNKVLRSHKGLALKEFRIYFDLGKSAQNAINHWLQFAFERRVERLELDLSLYGHSGRNRRVCALPMKKFQPHQPRSLFGSLKSLKALCLKSVDVTDQDVDFFLRNCPLLEHLVVDYALKILNLNICGALALKHLGILYCMNVKSLKVSAPNLTSLRVTNAVALLLENVPKLVEVYVSNGYTDVDKLVPSLYCCLSQLEILTLRLCIETKYIEENCKFPVLPNLKKLEIQYFAEGVESIMWVTSFMRAAPYLQEFVIKIYWYKFLRTGRNIKNAIHSPHQHLKVFKFLGYYGRASDVELVMYLLDNCAMLEKLIIDPRYQSFNSYAALDPAEVDGELTEGNNGSELVYPDEFDELDAVRTSRNYAKQQLQGQVAQHIDLVIL